MKLLKSPASPFARMVRVVAAEAGVELVEEDVTTTPYDTPAALKAANPVGKIPALVRHDAPTLFDSRVICRFLDDLGQGNLYPENRLWDVLTLEALAHGLTEAAVSIAYERRMRPEEIQSADWIEAQWQKVEHSMEALEAQWMGLLNGPLDIGQIACACALGYVDFRHDDRNWRARHPALAKWEADFSQRPTLQSTKPE